jgi:hypothetical protein
MDQWSDHLWGKRTVCNDPGLVSLAVEQHEQEYHRADEKHKQD